MIASRTIKRGQCPSIGAAVASELNTHRFRGRWSTRPVVVAIVPVMLARCGQMPERYEVVEVNLLLEVPDDAA